MPTVYVAPRRGSYFHRDEACTYLQRSKEVAPVDLEEISSMSPCLRCYEDAPRARSWHRRCYECNQTKARPCQHNGGVLVYMTRVTRQQTLFSEPGDIYIRKQYVWPENVRRYITS